MRQISGCEDATTCPGVFVEDERSVLVRGEMVEASTLERADGETVVRIPAGMLAEAASRL